MTCARCGHTNPERAKFCLECGAPIAARCASCGTELPPAAKFCLECGAAIKGLGVKGLAARGKTEPPTPNPLTPNPLSSTEARKVVTIIFADLIGSTSLHERLDPESVTRLMERYYRAMRGAVEAHGGTVVKLMGDGVMAAFGVPRVAEDDAIRAVRAGVAMQDAMKGLGGWGVGVMAQTLTP
jgi:ribosomal protein L40E